MKSRLRHTVGIVQRAFSSEENTLLALMVIVTLLWLILKQAAE